MHALGRYFKLLGLCSRVLYLVEPFILTAALQWLTVKVLVQDCQMQTKHLQPPDFTQAGEKLTTKQRLQ